MVITAHPTIPTPKLPVETYYTSNNQRLVKCVRHGLDEKSVNSIHTCEYATLLYKLQCYIEILVTAKGGILGMKLRVAMLNFKIS